MSSELEKLAETRSKQTCWSETSPRQVYAYGWLQGFNECLCDLMDAFIASGNKEALDKVMKMFELDKDPDLNK